MKKITQVALAALVLGVGSASVYAGGDDRGSSQHKPHKAGKHGCGDKCEGKMKIVLDIPRHCDLDILDETLTLTQARNGSWTDTGAFTVRTNAPYRLDISAPQVLNGQGGATIPVQVSTRQHRSGRDYNGRYLPSTKNADQRFNVTATVSNDNYSEADAGLYSGIYTVAVRF